MGDLTKNISRHELKCKCGNCDVRIQDHEPIIQVVQCVCDDIANEYGVDRVTLEITSAARCREHNLSVGSSDESQHIRCNAMDIKIFVDGEQVPPHYIANFAEEDLSNCDIAGGIGEYNTFTHIDTRNKVARW
jgi:uncharacterized protein YcbK (DUF882 family)